MRDQYIAMQYYAVRTEHVFLRHETSNDVADSTLTIETRVSSLPFSLAIIVYMIRDQRPLL
jgi:hypothetical protein